MAGSKENLHDVPEASTVDHINYDAENEAKPVENISLTDGDEIEPTGINDQPSDDNVPKDAEEISEEIPQIDESTIGHVAIGKCCEDLNTKIFSNHPSNSGMRDSDVAKRETTIKRKESIGSKRQSFRKSRQSKTNERKSHVRKSQSNDPKDKLFGALMDRLQSFVDDTMEQVGEIDKKLKTLEAPKDTEPPEND